ncbi:hypothetical protein 2 [Sanxia tombus-like virus 8]|uniref:hypothetical protein 2 n=1 Tax=Sanxia tombus-like virus 8 TaxID=1923392 RepID=UPI0009097A19|nr:hypothetical protein 2 [Sanxia tombus-like virus 8]APG76415.1 hypothetical protein 2 [Sanxia tombus-like virus 8]
MDSPSKRRFYQQVVDQIRNGRKITSGITPFTKLEKMGSNKYKAPRLIQARHPTFNIAYGCYIKPLERANKHKLQFGKGTYDEIGAKIHKLSRKYQYYTEGDHKTFDAHVTRDMLRICHEHYRSCYQQDNQLRRLCSKTLRNKARTREGENYSVVGTRMSGDVDTGYGNSIINYYILKKLLGILRIKGDAIVNGDDFILFTSSKLDSEQCKRILREFNMETEMGESTNNIHHIEFCRCRLIYHPDGHPTMAFDPDRLQKIYGATYLPWTDEQYTGYLQVIHHANFMINQNSPAHRQWRPLLSLEDKLKKYMTHSLERVFAKQSNNRVYKWDYLTPSYIEAYPNYKIDKPQYPYYKPVAPQKRIVINHNIKELFIV